MKIGIGSDHRGFKLKEIVRHRLTRAGHEVRDFGTTSEESVDYPDYALKVAKAVAGRRLDRGILICSSGIGMCIAANKVKGARAALCLNELMATRSRQHNDANLLCLGADFVSVTPARRIVDAWLAAEFEGGRHQRRLNRIRRQERKSCCE
jgi:ribose 5-phosphate isomerase B